MTSTIITANTIPTNYFTHAKPIIVLMGVCGCGKSTVAQHLVDHYDMKYAEADDFHPQANIDKMAAGHPLTDEDRWPWLGTIAAWIDERVAAGEPAVVFVYMQGTFDEVMERLSHRQGHFMKPSMLQSQFDILEEPGDDEVHVNVHIGQADPEHEAMAVADALGL